MALRIKEILKEKGMSQKDLASALGIAPTTFSLTINGNPTLGTLEKVAGALGVSVSELLDDQGRKTAITCPHCGGRISVEVKKGGE